MGSIAYTGPTEPPPAEELRSIMGELKDLHKTEIQTSTEAATINVKKKQFPLAEKFQFEQSLPNNSTGIDIPGRFDAELASCVVHGKL